MKELKNSKVYIPEIIKTLNGMGRKKLITMIALQGRENIILKKMMGLT